MTQNNLYSREKTTERTVRYYPQKNFYAIRIVLILASLFFIISCTTIKIKESDAFDAKKTVEAEYFQQKGIDLEEIYFFSDDTTKVKAWYLRHQNARGTVLYFGGNGFLLAISGESFNPYLTRK